MNKPVVAFALSLLASSTLNAATIKHKSGYTSSGTFTGPASTVGELEREDRYDEAHYVFPAIDEALQPWFDWKKSLNEEHGLQLGTYYTTLYQSVHDAIADAEDNAHSGILRLNGKWVLSGKGTKNQGSLVFNIDNRHKIGTDAAPADMASSAGYAGVTGTLFSDVGTVIVDMTWQQQLNGTKSGFIVGRFDPNDYVSVSGYASPWTGFQNVAIMLNPSIALPDASWGIGAGHWLNDSVYMLGTINDANGTIDDDLEFFDGGSEFFTSIEMGWTPHRDKRFTHQFNITLWQADERDDAGVGESDGVAISANWTFDNGLMPIFRAGWSDGDANAAPIYSDTYTIGVVYKLKGSSDKFGAAFNWGENTYSGLPEEQKTTEIFYNWTLSQNVNITPSVQLLQDPALNAEDDSVTVYGLRVRITL